MIKFIIYIKDVKQIKEILIKLNLEIMKNSLTGFNEGDFFNLSLKILKSIIMLKHFQIKK